MANSSFRDGSFNPTSPHSSSGAADSFKGTPDTRLTAFSPEENSTSKSARAHLSSVGKGLVSREAAPIRFNMTAPPTSLDLGQAKSLFPAGLNLEKDPFVSSDGPVTKAMAKLSPTASCFSPLSGPPVVGGNMTLAPCPADAQVRDSSSMNLQAGTNNSVLIFVHPSLSTDLGISRCVVFEAQGKSMETADVYQYFSKLQQRGFQLLGSNSVHASEGKVYARFSNIRDACLVSQNGEIGGPNWTVSPLDPRHFSRIVDRIPSTVTAHEGQVTVGLFSITGLQSNLNMAQVRDALQTSLMSAGDLFALKMISTGASSIFNAIVEYCDNEASLLAISKLGYTIIEGYQICMAIHRPDIPQMAAQTPARDNLASPTRQGASAVSDMANDFQRMQITGPQNAMTPAPPGVHQGVHQGAHQGGQPEAMNGMVKPFTPPVTAFGPNGAGTFTPNGMPSGVPGGVPTQPTYGVMPVIYPGMQAGSPYVFDQFPANHFRAGTPGAMIPTGGHGAMIPAGAHGAMIPAGNYSFVGAMGPLGTMYAGSPAMMNLEYMTPRQFMYPRPEGRRQNALRITRAPHHNINSQHNHVDTGRIREGTDVRTTIMLRNIPNKVDQPMLKRIVDESSWGKYDFMYLRIDFANDCNVGYAFINFVDPLDIIDFVTARGNQRWNCFKSDKVAEISYATIQGKDCLVQKFRNSSVMLEAPHYRPKLFFTSNGPRPEFAGTEEKFPVPDNQSKMKRSCENAEHVGLFTPNAGQHFRDEQRRRRSQYDRGTRLAAMEEFDYDAPSPYSPYSN